MWRQEDNMKPLKPEVTIDCRTEESSKDALVRCAGLTEGSSSTIRIFFTDFIFGIIPVCWWQQ